MSLAVTYLTFKEFVEQVFSSDDEATFISRDEAVEIIHYYDGIDHFEYHTADEQSGEYSTVDTNYEDIAIVMSLDLFDLLPDQVEGYID